MFRIYDVCFIRMLSRDGLLQKVFQRRRLCVEVLAILYNPNSCKAVTSSKVSSSGNSVVEVQPIECQSRTVRRFMSYD